MPFANNVTSYPDCQEHFERALASNKGIRIEFATADEATFQGGRFNAFRVRHRKQNAKIYPADHPMHRASEYDGIMVRVRDRFVELHKLTAEAHRIEEL